MKFIRFEESQKFSERCLLLLVVKQAYGTHTAKRHVCTCVDAPLSNWPNIKSRCHDKHILFILIKR